MSSLRHVDGYGRRSRTYRPSETDIDYMSNVLERMRWEAMRRRRARDYENEVDTTAAQAIEVDSVEFYSKDNAKVHQTAVYDLLDGDSPSPVLRRGSPFYLGIKFKRQINFKTDNVRLEFTFGPNNLMGKGTLVYLRVADQKSFTKDKTSWDICLSRQEKLVLIVQIQIPSMAGVGLWRLKIRSRAYKNNISTVFDCKENVYLLFNPWCKEDPVHMSSESDRQEYVLNDAGKIFVGSYSKPIGRPWIFGQFGDAVLPASIFLLEKSGLDYISRCNPVKVVRAISAMVNSNDDNGVLIGNWSNNYDDGTAPWSWTGSSAILEQFLSSGGQPVKYGQCWVFSGVCTTVCRALGIPCRSVTNYVSAHDTDDSLTVDIYIDSKGDRIDRLNRDSIWNFHVWNDCWMARPDLPSGYGGWQAIDSTPQETSEGAYRAGPASLVAVRRGEIGHMYDSPFLFAEVNADVVHWQEDDEADSGWKKIKTDTYRVGRMIVTKRVGFNDEFGNRDMDVISQEYKSKEGTPEERMTVLNAARKAGLSHIYDMPAPGKEDVRLTLRPIDSVMIGKPFEVIVEVQNLSDERRTVHAVLSASTVHYTGIIATKVKRARGSFTLKPRQKEELGIEVSVDDYLDKLVDYAMLKIYAIATVKETQQAWAEEDDFQVQKPTLKIEVEKSLRVGRRFKLRISFINPLQRVLRRCKLSIEGPGLSEARVIDLEDVGANATMIHIETLVPKKPGPRNIAVVFSSHELIEVIGTKHVEVMD